MIGRIRKLAHRELVTAPHIGLGNDWQTFCIIRVPMTKLGAGSLTLSHILAYTPSADVSWC